MAPIQGEYDLGEVLPSVGPVPVSPAPPVPPDPTAPTPPRATENSDDLGRDAAGLVDLGEFVRRSPPWLLSAVAHMVVVIVLGLWLVRSELEGPISLDASYGEEPAELTLDEMPDVSMLDELPTEELTLSAESVLDAPEPVDLPEFVPVFPDGTLSQALTPTAIGMALTGRDPSSRESLLKAMGGTAATEDAVMEGLRWLMRVQKSNGSWSLKGPYQGGTVGRDNPQAATAMSLLAFQGHGHTHQSPRSDPFSQPVRKGWNWLLSTQHKDGHFFDDAVGDARLYTHAMCTIAICELYGMTGDNDLRKPAQKAIDYAVAIQTSDGGWRYEPGRGSDLSVTGWFAMALQSARMAGIEVPSSTFDRLSEYLDSVQKDYGSQYSYRPNEGARLSMTAEGLLCRQYLGWERNDERLLNGANLLIQNLPDWEEQNVYYWYYATQVLHHMDGELWKTWNDVMRELLPKHQRKHGGERGSWNPERDRWGASGGRLYTTCLSIYILEVYYRHMPLYGHSAAPGGY